MNGRPTTLRRLLHRSGRFVRLPRHRRALLLEAVAFLLIARLSVRLVPFPRLARWLGAFVGPNDARVASSAELSSAQTAAAAREVGWAVTRAARHAPFRAVCLPQAIAARMMLRRRRIVSVMHFGGAIPSDRAGFDAHAWLDAAGVEVTGYPIPREMAEIACLV